MESSKHPHKGGLGLVSSSRMRTLRLEAVEAEFKPRAGALTGTLPTPVASVRRGERSGCQVPWTSRKAGRGRAGKWGSNAFSTLIWGYVWRQLGGRRDLGVQGAAQPPGHTEEGERSEEESIDRAWNIPLALPGLELMSLADPSPSEA